MIRPLLRLPLRALKLSGHPLGLPVLNGLSSSCRPRASVLVALTAAASLKASGRNPGRLRRHSWPSAPLDAACARASATLRPPLKDCVTGLAPSQPAKWDDPEAPEHRTEKWRCARARDNRKEKRKKATDVRNDRQNSHPPGINTEASACPARSALPACDNKKPAYEKCSFS